MTGAGDQVASLTITNGGYGIPQTIDGTYNFIQQLHLQMLDLTQLVQVQLDMQFWVVNC